MLQQQKVITQIDELRLMNLFLSILKLFIIFESDKTTNKVVEEDFMICIFRYIPGKVIGDVPHSKHLYFHSGKMVAKVANSLMVSKI